MLCRVGQCSLALSACSALCSARSARPAVEPQPRFGSPGSSRVGASPARFQPGLAWPSLESERPAAVPGFGSGVGSGVASLRSCWNLPGVRRTQCQRRRDFSVKSLKRGVPFLNHDTILTLSRIPVLFSPPFPSHLVLSHPIPSSSPVPILSHPHNYHHRHPLPLSLGVLPGAKHRVYLHRRSTRSRPRLSHAGTCHILASRWHSGEFNTRPITRAFLGRPSWEERCWVQLDSPFPIANMGSASVFRQRYRCGGPG